MFSNLFPPIPSGSSHITYRLARQLVSAGHKVTVFSARLDESPTQEVLSGINVIRLPALRLPNTALAHNFKWLGLTLMPGNFSTLFQVFKQEKFDIIHAHNHIFDLALVAVWMAKRTHLPLALTLHTIVQHPVPLYNLPLTVLDSTAARWLIVRRADAVISVDIQMKNYIARRFGIYQTPMIPYGIDIPDINPGDRMRIRADYGLGHGPVILSLGHVHALRSRWELIHAMPQVLARYPDARLLIVGDVCIDAPRQWIAQLGLEGKIIFTGAVSREEVPAYFAAADVEAHWLAGVSALSLAGMEAMAAGLPVVTAEFPNEEEANGLINWENVVTVPRDDPKATAEALLRLLDNPDLRQRIGRNGQCYIKERFSWESVCRKTEDLYLKLIERNRMRTRGTQPGDA